MWYHFPVPKLDSGSEPEREVRLVRWLVEEGAQLRKGSRVAIIQVGSESFYVLANGDGFIREKMFPNGASVVPCSSLATINADGENIPYDRPYSLAERIEP
jgi:pyruvate/2-oxoglutarate dehydrogenase complex dihydrolipoamide acyltransferase (E2) component